MTATSNEGAFGRFRSALNTSNGIISGLSTNISSRFSAFSSTSVPSQGSSSAVPSEDRAETPPLQLPPTPESSHQSLTMKEIIKETFKLDNLREFRPTLDELIQSESSSEPSTLPTNTPESPKEGFRYHFNNFNKETSRRLTNAKSKAMRTFSNETTGVNPECAINVEYVGESEQDLEEAVTPDMITSSGTPSDTEGTGMGHSVSLDSSDSDPHKKLWIKSGSQGSLQSWASSLSYDSQADDMNDPKEFMRKFVEDVFKLPHTIDVDRKAQFGEQAQVELGRLWFARCINAKRYCKNVSEATFFSLTQHFSVVLFECSEADDFSPAKSLMNMCFTFYHEAHTPGGQNRRKEFLYTYLRQQVIFKSSRFWNAAFFDALQCERSMRPLVKRQDLENGQREETLRDEVHYQENITFGQLGTFTCNMHAFGISKEMVADFLRKQVTIASLRPDQVKLLKENVERMYSSKQEWQ